MGPSTASPGADDPALPPVRVLVEEHLALAPSTWTAGPPGARARFAREPDDPAFRGPHLRDAGILAQPPRPDPGVADPDA